MSSRGPPWSGGPGAIAPVALNPDLVRGEPHIQRNASGVVATLEIPLCKACGNKA